MRHRFHSPGLPADYSQTWETPAAVEPTTTIHRPQISSIRLPTSWSVSVSVPASSSALSDRQYSSPEQYPDLVIQTSQGQRRGESETTGLDWTGWQSINQSINQFSSVETHSPPALLRQIRESGFRVIISTSRGEKKLGRVGVGVSNVSNKLKLGRSDWGHSERPCYPSVVGHW